MPEIFLPRIASHTIRGFFCYFLSPWKKVTKRKRDNAATLLRHQRGRSPSGLPQVIRWSGYNSFYHRFWWVGDFFVLVLLLRPCAPVLRWGLVRLCPLRVTPATFVLPQSRLFTGLILPSARWTASVGWSLLSGKKIGIVFIGNDKSNSIRKFLEDGARGREPFFKKVSFRKTNFATTSFSELYRLLLAGIIFHIFLLLLFCC